jgi:hypothetical protein
VYKRSRTVSPKSDIKLTARTERTIAYAPAAALANNSHRFSRKVQTRFAWMRVSLTVLGAFNPSYLALGLGGGGGCGGGGGARPPSPDKPKRMRWATYNRMMEKLVAADGVADERLISRCRRARATPPRWLCAASIRRLTDARAHIRLAKAGSLSVCFRAEPAIW